MRPVALPALEALGGVVARAVAVVVDHVEDIALGALLGHRVFIVGTVDIQVVVYAHVDVVVSTVELGVGPVPEDGVAVGHHFGTGLLAKYTHQQHQAEEDDHFHLQHHYGETSARIPLRCRFSQSGCTLGASTGTGDERLIHIRGRWRSL